MIRKYREVAHSFSWLWFLQDTLTWSASHLWYKWLCSKFVSWKHFNSFCIMHDFYVGYISTNLSMILLMVPNLLSFCLIWQAAFTPEDLYTRKWSLDLQVGQVLGTGFSVFLTFHVAQLEDKPWRYDVSTFSFCLAIVTIFWQPWQRVLCHVNLLLFIGVWLRTSGFCPTSREEIEPCIKKSTSWREWKRRDSNIWWGCEQIGWNLWELPASSKPPNYSKLCIYKVWLG